MEIGDAKGTCACTVADVKPGLLANGESRKLKLIITTPSTPEEFNQAVVIKDATGKIFVSCKLRAKVISIVELAKSTLTLSDDSSFSVSLVNNDPQFVIEAGSVSASEGVKILGERKVEGVIVVDCQMSVHNRSPRLVHNISFALKCRRTSDSHLVEVVLPALLETKSGFQISPYLVKMKYRTGVFEGRLFIKATSDLKMPDSVDGVITDEVSQASWPCRLVLDERAPGLCSCVVRCESELPNELKSSLSLRFELFAGQTPSTVPVVVE